MILVLQEFLQTSMRPLICVLYAKGYHDFTLKTSCLTVPKNFLEEPFCFRKYLVSKNVRDERGCGYHDFPSKLFCLTLPKNFVGETFSISEKFQYRKILCFGGLCHDFPSKLFCLTVPKHFEEALFCAVFRRFPVAKKFMDKRGGGREEGSSITIFRRKFFLS